MKRWLTSVLILIAVVLPQTCLAEISHITYEQFVSGDFYGQEVEMNAKVIYHPYYIWAIEKEDGTFETVDETYNTWYLQEAVFDKAKDEEKEALKNGDVVILTVLTSDTGKVYSKNFRLQGTLSQDELLRRMVYGGIGIAVFLILFLIVLHEYHKKHPLRKRHVPVKTKIICTTHITRRRGTRLILHESTTIGGLRSVTGRAIPMDDEFDTTTFMVYYSDGSKKKKTVINTCYDYKEYMSMLDLSDD